jgi:hypothetical protein
MSLIATEHRPGILEKNKTLEAQLEYVRGPKLDESMSARLFFGPGGTLVSKGAKTQLQDADVWLLDDDNSAEHIWDKIEPAWREEQKKPK